MKKEVLIAVFFGLIVGLVITIGMYRARTALEIPPPDDSLAISATTQPSPSPASQAASQDGLIVREPREEALSTTANLQVSGSTFPSRTIVILLNEREVLGASDVQGNFSIPVTLSVGPNIIKVRVLNPGQPASETVRTVIYELPLGAIQADTTATASASPSAKPKSRSL